MSRMRICGSCAIRSSVLPWFVRKANSGAARGLSASFLRSADTDIATYNTRY